MATAANWVVGVEAAVAAAHTAIAAATAATTRNVRQGPTEVKKRLFSAISLTKAAKLFTNEVPLSSANDLPQLRNRVVSRDWDVRLRQSDGANRADLAGR